MCWGRGDHSDVSITDLSLEILVKIGFLSFSLCINSKASLSKSRGKKDGKSVEMIKTSACRGDREKRRAVKVAFYEQHPIITPADVQGESV